MSKMKRSGFFRIIALVLSAAFISFDISWAYPAGSNSGDSALALPSAFQQQPVNEQAERFQQSVFLNGKLLESIYSIAECLFYENVPIDHLDYILTTELGDAVKDVELLHVTFEDGIISVPCEIDGSRRVLQVALKDSPAAVNLTGRELAISNRYVVKEREAKPYYPQKAASAAVKGPAENSGASSAETTVVYEVTRSGKRTKRVIVSGGGSGITFFDRTFKDSGWVIKKAITPFDTGGSTGDLQKMIKSTMKIESLASGDLTKAIVNLAPRERREVLEYRFVETGKDACNKGKGRFKESVESLLIKIKEKGEKEDPTLRTDTASWNEFCSIIAIAAENVDKSFPDIELKGHTVRNLMLLGSILLEGGYGENIFNSDNIQKGLERFCYIAGVEDSTLALPTSIDLMDSGLVVKYGDNEILEDQGTITNTKHEKPIADLYFGKGGRRPSAYNLCIEEIDSLREGDLFILGPGSFYTSILVNLLPDGITDALKRARERGAIITFVFNPMYDNETDFMREGNGINPYVYMYNQIERHTHCSFSELFDYCILEDPAQTPSEVKDAMTYIEKEGRDPRNNRYGPIGTAAELDKFKGFVNSQLKSPVIISGQFTVRNAAETEPYRRATYDNKRFRALFDLILRDRDSQKEKNAVGHDKVVLSDTHATRDSLERVKKSNPGLDIWLVGDLLDRGSEFEEMVRLVDYFTLGDHDLWFLGAAMGDEYSIALHTFMLERYPGQKNSLQAMGINLTKLENYAKNTKDDNGKKKYDINKLKNLELYLRIKSLPKYVGKYFKGDWNGFYTLAEGKGFMFTPEERKVVGALINGYQILDDASSIKSSIEKIKKLRSKLSDEGVEKDIKKALDYRGISSVEEQAIFNIWAKLAFKEGVLSEEDFRKIPEPIWQDYFKPESSLLTAEERDVMDDLKRQFLTAPGVQRWAQTLWHGKGWGIVSAVPELRADKDLEKEEWIKGLNFWQAGGNYRRSLLLHAITPMNKDGWLIDLDGNPIVSLKNEDGSWRKEVTDDEKKLVLGYYNKLNSELEEVGRRYDRFLRTKDENAVKLADELFKDYRKWLRQISDGQHSPLYARKHERFYNNYIANTEEHENCAYAFLKVPDTKPETVAVNEKQLPHELARLLCAIFDVDNIIIGHISSKKEDVITVCAGGAVIKVDTGSTEKASKSGALESTERGGSAVLKKNKTQKTVLIKVADILADTAGIKFKGRNNEEKPRDNLLTAFNLRDLIYYKGSSIPWEDLFKAPMLMRDLLYLLRVKNAPVILPGAGESEYRYKDDEWRGVINSVAPGIRQEIIDRIKTKISSALSLSSEPVSLSSELAEGIAGKFEDEIKDNIFVRNIFRTRPHRPRLPVMITDLVAGKDEAGEVSGYFDASEIGDDIFSGVKVPTLEEKSASEEGWRNLYSPIAHKGQDNPERRPLPVHLGPNQSPGAQITVGLEANESDVIRETREEVARAKKALIQKAQKLLDFLDGKSYQTKIGAKDFSKEEGYEPLIFAVGSPSPEAFVNAAREWSKYSEEWGRQIPVVASTGRGRGAVPFIENTQDYYDKSGRYASAESFRELRKRRNGELTEAEVIKFIFMQEGVPEDLIYLEMQSDNTFLNIAMSFDNVINAKVYPGSKNGKVKILVVADAFHRLRALLYTMLVLRRGANSRKCLDWKVTAVPFYQPVLSEMDEDKLCGTEGRIGYLAQWIGNPYDKNDLGGEIGRFLKPEFQLLDSNEAGYKELTSRTKNWEKGIRNLRDKLLKDFLDAKKRLARLYSEASLPPPNSRRAKFIEAGNKVITSLPATATKSAAGIGSIDNKMATVEIRQGVERAIAIIDGLKDENLPSETRAAVEQLRKNLNQLEADGAVASLIILARRAKKENQKLIIGLETDWIPAVNVKDSLQRQAIFALMKEIDAIGETLGSMGLDNVEIVRGSGEELAGDLLDRADKTHTAMHNIVVMASKTTIESDGFADLRNADENNRPFLTSIDPTKLIEAYVQYGEDMQRQLYVRLAQMLYMTLEAATGKWPPREPWIVYDNVKRTLLLVPSAKPIDYELLRSNYAAERTALAAA